MYALAPHQFSSVVCQTQTLLHLLDYTLLLLPATLDISPQSSCHCELHTLVVDWVKLIDTLGDGTVRYHAAPSDDDDDIDDNTGYDGEHSAPSPVHTPDDGNDDMGTCTSPPLTLSHFGLTRFNFAFIFITMAVLVSAFFNVLAALLTHTRKFWSKYEDLGNNQSGNLKTSNIPVLQLRLGQLTPRVPRSYSTPEASTPYGGDEETKSNPAAASNLAAPHSAQDLATVNPPPHHDPAP
ncbi:hypothetical protein EDB83DRAFT_2526129 [Lactarius deliciosus]|nr:hypothetical protein EDB83DRAFT_2526129 [Lactarius deliciosus]